MRKPFILLAIFFFAFTTVRSEQAVFSEIMYHPSGTKPEYIEIWNCTMTPLDMAKWRFTDGVSYEFPDFNSGAPQDHFLKPLERIVVSAADAATTRAAYGISPAVRVFGPWTGALENAGERITLADKNGVTVTTGEIRRWRALAEGGGRRGPHARVAQRKQPYRLVAQLASEPVQKRLARRRGVHRSRAVWQQSRSRCRVPAQRYSTTGPHGNISSPRLIRARSWRTQGFDDTSWGSGPGLLGFENAPLPPPGIQTPVGAPGPITYLFRKTFTFPAIPWARQCRSTRCSMMAQRTTSTAICSRLSAIILAVRGIRPLRGRVGDAVEELNAISGAATGW
jgi:hypothetical protein